MNGTKYIINKELARVFKDKKMIFSLFILPAILMFAIYGLMGQMISSVEQDVVEHTSIVYIANAPEGLEDTIKEVGVAMDIKKADNSQIEEIKQNILEAEADLLVVFDENYLETVKGYTSAGDSIPSVKLYYNSTVDYSSAAYSTFSAAILGEYETKLLAERLGNLEMLTISNVETELIQKEERANGQFLSMMLPYLVVMLLFSSAMSISVDSIAGEKERGTMASMLLTPIRRTDIVVGKIVSLSILAGLSALVYAVSLILAIPLMGNPILGGETGVSFSIVQILELVAIMVCLVYLFVALITLISVYSKGIKEAQTYISPIYIVVILAGIMTMFTTQAEKPVYQYAIPIYGNALAMKDIMVNELTTTNFLASLAGIVVIAVVLTYSVAKAFNNEKVMFNA